MKTKRAAKELPDLLAEVLEIIEAAERRAMAYDGPVADTVDALRDSELRKIYRLTRSAKRRLEGFLRREADDRRVFLEDLDETRVARAIHDADETDVLAPFRRPWKELKTGRREQYVKAARRLKASLFKVRAVL